MAIPNKAETASRFLNRSLGQPCASQASRMGTGLGSTNASRCPTTRGPAAYCRAKTSS